MGNRFLQEFIGSREDEAPPLPSIDGFSKAQFWDGRTSTLEDQSVGPLTNPIEHGFANNDAVVSTIKK
jgi:cytochrome c peroxidase